MRPSILAVSTGNIGDLLACAPALRALSRHFGTKLTALTSPATAALLPGHPAVAEVLVDDGTTEQARIIEALRSREFSHAVVFWSTARNARMVQRAGIPVRVGPAGRLYSWFRYTISLKMRADSGDIRTHASENLMDMARALGARPQPEDFRIAIKVSAESATAASALLSALNVSGPFVAFKPVRGLRRGAHWPAATFAEIGDALGSEFGLPVVLVGSPDEVDAIEAIADRMRRPHAIAAGRTNLSTLEALLSRATAFVGLDSGPAHIAAALGVPTLAIFAMRTDLPQRWRPLGPRVAVVEPSYACPRGCRKETCRVFACCASLDPALIARRAVQLASTGPYEQPMLRPQESHT